MGQEFEDDAQASAPSRAGRGAWVVFKETLKTAVKWAAIGALMLAAVSLPFGGVTALAESVPLLGTHLLAPVAKAVGWGSADWLVGGLSTGAMVGGIAGAVIGLASSVSNVEDTLDDMDAQAATQAARARQQTAQEQMLAMNMQRMGAYNQAQQQGGYMPNYQQVNQSMPAGPQVAQGRTQ